MKKYLEDYVLQKIAKAEPLAGEELRIIDRLKNRGLVVEKENRLSLTTQGEIFQIMGYQRTTRDIHGQNMFQVTLLVIFVIVAGVLLAIAFLDLLLLH